MKKVIDKVIGEEQNAFIQGRYILDGGLIANEACDYLKKEKKKAFLMKIDFEKAYDSVNWKLELYSKYAFTNGLWRKMVQVGSNMSKIGFRFGTC